MSTQFTGVDSPTLMASPTIVVRRDKPSSGLVEIYFKQYPIISPNRLRGSQTVFNGINGNECEALLRQSESLLGPWRRKKRDYRLLNGYTSVPTPSASMGICHATAYLDVMRMCREPCISSVVKYCCDVTSDRAVQPNCPGLAN